MRLQNQKQDRYIRELMDKNNQQIIMHNEYVVNTEKIKSEGVIAVLKMQQMES